ncbi:MAG: type II secretion system major pseudopilin GspG [Steroidobacteraceae bacterium]
MTCRKQELQRGFTLVEIMVVVVIIGLLATAVLVNVVGRIDESRVTKAQTDISALETTLELYRLDNFQYPTTEQGLKALNQKPADPNVTNWKGPYLKRSSKDPWGRDYVYTSPGEHGEFDLSSLGADGKPGGEKFDADIGNWNLEQ